MRFLYLCGLMASSLFIATAHASNENEHVEHRRSPAGGIDMNEDFSISDDDSSSSHDQKAFAEEAAQYAQLWEEAKANPKKLFPYFSQEEIDLVGRDISSLPEFKPVNVRMALFEFKDFLKLQNLNLWKRFFTGNRALPDDLIKQASKNCPFEYPYFPFVVHPHCETISEFCWHELWEMLENRYPSLNNRVLELYPIAQRKLSMIDLDRDRIAELRADGNKLQVLHLGTDSPRAHKLAKYHLSKHFNLNEGSEDYMMFALYRSLDLDKAHQYYICCAKTLASSLLCPKNNLIIDDTLASLPLGQILFAELLEKKTSILDDCLYGGLRQAITPILQSWMTSKKYDKSLLPRAANRVTELFEGRFISGDGLKLKDKQISKLSADQKTFYEYFTGYYLNVENPRIKELYVDVCEYMIAEFMEDWLEENQELFE